MNMKRIKKHLHSFISMLLVITILTQSLYITPMTAHAEIAVPQLASPSNAISPMSLEVPDSSAFISGMTATEWVWETIFSMFGVKVKDSSASQTLSSAITDWIQNSFSGSNKNVLLEVLVNLEKIGWGEILHGMPTLKQAVGEYFASKKGFGTDAGLSNITISIPGSFSNSFSQEYGGNYESHYGAGNYVGSAQGYYDHYLDMCFDAFLPSNFDNSFNVSAYINGATIEFYIYNPIISRNNCTAQSLDFVIYHKGKFYAYNSNIGIQSVTDLDLYTRSFMFPIYETYNEMQAYLQYGQIGLPMNGFMDDGSFAQGLELQVNSSPAIQQKSNELNMADDLVLPADADSGAQALENIASATTTDDLAKALADYLRINYIVTDNISKKKYDDFIYVLTSLCATAGLTNITTSILNDFVDTLVDDGEVTIPDDWEDSIISLEEHIRHVKAEMIFDEYLRKSGNDNNNDNNKFKILKRLLISFGAFLLGAGLVSDVPEFVSSNNIDINDELPSDPSISPKPTDDVDNSNTITISLKEIIDSQKQILDLLISFVSDYINSTESLLNYINLIPENIVSKLALSDLLDHLLNDLSILINNIPIQIIDLLNLDELAVDINLNMNKINEKLSEATETIKSLPDNFKNNIPPVIGTDEGFDYDNDDKSFQQFTNFVICIIFIILLLILIFANCVRLIVTIFNIPASNNLFNADVLKGLDFTKKLIIPNLNVSLYSLLVGIAFFLCIMSIIGLLKKRIDKLHE